MQRLGTGSSSLWRGRVTTATIAAMLLASGALAGLPPAYAISPPTIDPGALPPDSPPGPVAPMKQNSYCTEVGVLPGTDFRLQPKYMDMLNLSEAWQFGRGAGVRVAVIDTGVTPHPRFAHLLPGGDYVMAGGDGLSDCDAHGTIVASMIGASAANGAVAPPAAPRRPVTIPTTEKPPPPQTITLSPVPNTTVTVIPAPPPASPSEGAPPGSPPGPPGPGNPPAANHGGGTVTIPGYSGGRQIVGVDHPRPLDPAPSPTPAPPPPRPA
ncbi:S8 family serine peptidase, partial [Mycobacterium kubicae]|uniref:S8 family serine peptidase n=1 Tax=Mycobacterium kubicae TaxID=120959 RepID=UPI000AAB0154